MSDPGAGGCGRLPGGRDGPGYRMGVATSFASRAESISLP